MDDHPLADLNPDERNLLAVFARHGRDGRAITTVSLAVLAGLEGERTRFSRALRRLLARGIIKEAGGDPFAGSALAYRLTQRAPPRAQREIDKQTKAI
jgi:hypothetical protein